MIDSEKKEQKREQKERVRKRMRVSVDPANYRYIPEKIKVPDYYDDEAQYRVGIYVRVSTEDIRQTTSFELQKKYYEDFVKQHPNWTLIDIYADEGISGTSIKHRDNFLRMISDCKSGKITLVITKSVSRFARNVEDFVGMVGNLAELNPPVGVFFESEAIFSLNDDSQLALTFVATMAQEESHTRSRSMETSLRMRLDHGIPLTPKLLGFTHDEKGKLTLNPNETPTVKLMFYMYLYGYSTLQIAKALNALGRKSYLGNIKWTSSTVTQVLRNERHCGTVITRKTFTKSYKEHKVLINHGEKPQSVYLKHHDPIVSIDDYIAVQRMLDNGRYKNRNILPELRVIDSGIFKGFTVINPRWTGFREAEYVKAAQSVYDESEMKTEHRETKFEVEAGDFDLRGFEIARTELFDSKGRPYVTFERNSLKFSAECIKRFKEKNYVEMLFNPITRKFAIRPTDKDNRCAVVISSLKNGKYQPKAVSALAFGDTVFSLLGWNASYKYRITGALYENNNEMAYIFDAENSEAYFKEYLLSNSIVNGKPEIQPLTTSGKYVKAIPEEWTNSFGMQFYEHEQPLSVLESQSKDDWKLRLQGQLFETGRKLNVTDFDVIKEYIQQSLSGITIEEDNNEQTC